MWRKKNDLPIETNVEFTYISNNPSLNMKATRNGIKFKRRSNLQNNKMSSTREGTLRKVKMSKFN